MTTARWYGGHAAVPSERSFCVEEREQALRVEQRLGLLEQEALVRRAAALGHEQEVVRVAVGRVELDLRRQVRAGVLLVEHVERRDLRVAQVRAWCRCRRRRAQIAASSPPPVSTYWPRLPMTIAVPVSWHTGSTPPAAMFAFFEQVERDELDRSPTPRGRRGSSRSCARWPGRSRCAMSRIASAASRRSASGSTSRKVRPAASTVRTPSSVSRRYSVVSGPVGSRSVYANSGMAVLF